MTGTNELIICKAEMIKLIQYYVDNIMFKEDYSGVVRDVASLDTGSNGFKILISDTNEDKG